MICEHKQKKIDKLLAADCQDCYRNTKLRQCHKILLSIKHLPKRQQDKLLSDALKVVERQARTWRLRAGSLPKDTPEIASHD